MPVRKLLPSKCQKRQRAVRQLSARVMFSPGSPLLWPRLNDNPKATDSLTERSKCVQRERYQKNKTANNEKTRQQRFTASRQIALARSRDARQQQKGATNTVYISQQKQAAEPSRHPKTHVKASVCP